MLTGVQPVVTIMFEGGGEVADIRDIMPSSRLNARNVFRPAFYDERLATDPEDSVVVAGAGFAIVYLLVQAGRLRTVADVPRNLSPVD